MKAGDLVQWSQEWLDGCHNAKDPAGELALYKIQVGILIERVSEPPQCWKVLWSDKDVSDVHFEYLEVLCK